MQHIALTLSNYLQGSKKGGPNRDIAQYMLAHLDVLSDLRVSDVAEACYVSSPTVIRFCRELGFKDYSSFREQVRNELEDDKHRQYDIDQCSLVVQGADYPEAVEGWTRTVDASIHDALLSLDRGQVERLAHDIVGHQYFFCYGYDASAMFGNYLSSRLAYQSRAVIARSSLVPDDTARTNPDESISVVVSMHGNALRERPQAPSELARCSERVWLVTMMPRGSFNEQAFDGVIYLQGSGSMRMEIFSLLTLAELVGQYCWVLHKQAD